MFAVITLVFFAVPPDHDAVIHSIAGTGKPGYTGDGGDATEAKLNNPFDVTFDAKGNLYVSDTNNHCVRKIDIESKITTVAGTGKKGYSGDGGPAKEATLNEPYGIDFDAEGNLYIVDRLNFCIRRIDAKTQIITTIAGTGKSGNSNDGVDATKAELSEPNGICLDGKGMLYIADVKAQKVRSVDLKTGLIGTLVGTGEKKTIDGALAKAACQGPRAVCMDKNGDVLLVEREGHCVRRIDLNAKTIIRIAGTGKKGYSGDGGKAIDATFDGPKELDVDKYGNIYIVDTENEVIRHIDAKTSIITTIAGKGKSKTPGLGDGGLATNATLGRPHGVAVSPFDWIVIGDTLSHQIRKVRGPVP